MHTRYMLACMQQYTCTHLMEMEIGAFEFVHLCLVILCMEDRLRRAVLLVSGVQSYGLPVWSVKHRGQLKLVM